MARGKDPSQWSAAYRHRIERYLEKHPTASLAEARGHRIERPPEPALPHEKPTWRETMTLITTKELLSNVNLKERLGLISSDRAAKDREYLQRFRELVQESRKTRVGSDQYFKNQEKLKRLYSILETRDYFTDDDREAGKVFYH